MIGIYKITSPNGKIYIGQSTNIFKRRNKYSNNECYNQTKIYRSLLKYGFDSHIFEVIEECPSELLNEKEIYWGEYYDVLGEKGLNCRLGNSKGYCSEETKLKISKANKGHKVSLEQRLRTSKLLKGRKKSPEHCRKISEGTKGIKRPYSGNKHLAPEHIDILCKARKNVYRPIYQYDLEGNFIKEWSQAKKAAINLNINTGCLCTITDNFNRTLDGFRFTSVYYDKLPPIVLWSDRKKITLQYDKQGNFIKEWGYAKEAAAYLGGSVRNISACCRGEVPQAYGFKWKYK